MTRKQRIKNFFLGICKFFEILVIDVILSNIVIAIAIIVGLLIVNWMWG